MFRVRRESSRTSSQRHQHDRRSSADYLLLIVAPVLSRTSVLLLVLLLVVSAASVGGSPVKSSRSKRFFDLQTLIENPCGGSKQRRHIIEDLQNQLKINNNHLDDMVENLIGTMNNISKTPKKLLLSGIPSGEESLKRTFIDMVKNNKTFVAYYKSFLLHYLQLKHLYNIKINRTSDSFSYTGRKNILIDLSSYIRLALCSMFDIVKPITTITEEDISSFKQKYLIYNKSADETTVLKYDVEVLDIAIFLHHSLKNFTFLLNLTHQIKTEIDNHKLLNDFTIIQKLRKSPHRNKHQQNLTLENIATKWLSFRAELKCINKLYNFDYNSTQSITINKREYRPRRIIQILRKWTNNLVRSLKSTIGGKITRNKKKHLKFCTQKQTNRHLLGHTLKKFYSLLELLYQNLTRN